MYIYIYIYIYINIKKIKKLRHGFVDERALITTTLIVFLSLEILYTFLYAKENTRKRILTLTVNYCKIGQKIKLCHPKQQ